MLAILLMVLTALLIAAMPIWPYSRNWGYHPSGGVGIVLAVILLLLWITSEN
jgi:Protein of unknown function (DUF3309)